MNINLFITIFFSACSVTFDLHYYYSNTVKSQILSKKIIVRPVNFFRPQ